MPNRRLSDEERETIFAPILESVRARLIEAGGSDAELHWALRRKLAKELTYDERSKPMKRKALKQKKRASQDGLCADCRESLPDCGAVLDRNEAMAGYTFENTRLLCPSCDVAKQGRLKYS